MLEPKSSPPLSESQTGSLPDELLVGLEYRVLELVIKGYQKMHEARHFNLRWKENKFSAVLTAHIKKHCEEFSRMTKRPWYIIREYHHDDESIMSGEGDPDAASRIDIVVLSWTADYQTIKFPFECKRVAENSSNLTRLYVEKGIIDRFLGTKDYSDELPWGGMIGYILNGTHSAVVVKLNEQISRQLYSSTEYLKIIQPVSQFDAVYTSQHKHPKIAGNITITHLLMSFSS